MKQATIVKSIFAAVVMLAVAGAWAQTETVDGITWNIIVSDGHAEIFGGSPVGLSTIAVSVGEKPDTIEEAYEPFLIMECYLERTPKGRVATSLARELFA